MKNIARGAAFVILNMGIISATDLTLEGIISNEVKITTQYNTLTNYATFTNTGTSIIVESGGGLITL